MEEKQLYEMVARIFPGATMNWVGRDDPDSAVVEWLDGHIVASRDYDDADNGQYLVCIYGEGQWLDGEDPSADCIVDSRRHAVMLIDDLTEEPEGVNWHAWAVQWLADAIADGRVKGFVS